MAHEKASDMQAQPARDHAVAVNRAANTLIDAIEAAVADGFTVKITGLDCGLHGYRGAFDVQAVAMDGVDHDCTIKGISVRHREPKSGGSDERRGAWQNATYTVKPQ